MVVYPKVVASAYATIVVLREILSCKLPIEIWFIPREMDPFPGALDTLLDLVGVEGMGEIYFHEVLDPLAVGFRVKVHAIYNSIFERVLYLDADNVPVRDPSFLFESREFLETGAMFWPDFWHPSSSIFNIHSRSLLWEMLDIPFVNMFEQESGQLLVDRRKHAVRLELVRFYAFYEPDYFDRMKLVHGDKDLFRLAWLKLRAPLYMIRTPPAVAGKVINRSFCGMTMVQHDARDPVFWTHLVTFRNTSERFDYVIDTYSAEPEFAKEQNCYGQRELVRVGIDDGINTFPVPSDQAGIAEELVHEEAVPHEAHAATQIAMSSNYTLPHINASAVKPRDGIVMVVYPKLVPSAYATIRALRDILGCSLPIEIWYRPDEMKDTPGALAPLQRLAQNYSVGDISFHKISSPVAKRFVAKIYAIYRSFFDRVLFLDADNVPVRDPSFLFESPEFKETGAIFWPDFWHPTSTMFGLHSKSLLWELLDMPFVDMFEQESGQLVIDRRRHAAPLALVVFYALHEPNFLVHYKLAWGDKDLFRLAWLNRLVSNAGIGLSDSFDVFKSRTYNLKGQEDEKDDVAAFEENITMPEHPISPFYKRGDGFDSSVSRDRGVMVCMHDGVLSMGLSLIRELRCLGNKELIQVYHCGEEELSASTVELLFSLDDRLEFVDACSDLESQGIISTNMTTKFRSWWIKPLAMYHTDVRHVMLLDVDDIIMRDPAVLRDLEGYVMTGTTFFYDRVLTKKKLLIGNDGGKLYLRKLLHEFDYARFNVSKGLNPSQHVFETFAFKGRSCHEMDSSMVLIDKERAGHTVMDIMLWFITEERFRFMYSWGDKETFWLAFELAHVPYSFSPKVTDSQN
ncbi:hypothetical protein BBJ29_009376 [Phytophthora kernoviae]|nr:hypothetical protein BBJ29_009376 [Phytophthora kernoviae]